MKSLTVAWILAVSDFMTGERICLFGVCMFKWILFFFLRRYHVVGKCFWRQARRGGDEGPLLHLPDDFLGSPLARISQ